MIKKYIPRLYPFLFVVFLLLFPFSFLAAQETQPLILASQTSMIQQFAMGTKSETFRDLVLLHFHQKFKYKKSICRQKIGKNTCPSISKSPLFIKDSSQIGHQIDNLRRIYTKSGNIVYQINNDGVSMKFYLTQYFMSQP